MRRALIIFDPLMPTSPRFITFMPPSSKSYKFLNLSSSISVFHIIWDVWAFAGGKRWSNGRWGLLQGAQGVVDISGLIVSEKTVSLVPQHPLLMHCKYYYRFLLLFYSNEFQWQQTTSEVILKKGLGRFEEEKFVLQTAVYKSLKDYVWFNLTLSYGVSKLESHKYTK